MVDTNQTSDQEVMDPVDDDLPQRRRSGVTIDMMPDADITASAAMDNDTGADRTGATSETVPGVSAALGDDGPSSTTGSTTGSSIGSGGVGSGGSGAGGSGNGGSGSGGYASSGAPDSAGRDYQRSLFIRLLYMIGYGVLAWMLFGLVLFLALLQFIVGVLNKELNEELRGFTRRAIVYLTDLLAYVTFIKEDKPFPLGKLPE